MSNSLVNLRIRLFVCMVAVTINGLTCHANSYRDVATHTKPYVYCADGLVAGHPVRENIGLVMAVFGTSVTDEKGDMLISMIEASDTNALEVSAGWATTDDMTSYGRARRMILSRTTIPESRIFFGDYPLLHSDRFYRENNWSSAISMLANMDEEERRITRQFWNNRNLDMESAIRISGASKSTSVVYMLATNLLLTTPSYQMIRPMSSHMPLEAVAFALSLIEPNVITGEIEWVAECLYKGSPTNLSLEPLVVKYIDSPAIQTALLERLRPDINPIPTNRAINIFNYGIFIKDTNNRAQFVSALRRYTIEFRERSDSLAEHFSNVFK